MPIQIVCADITKMKVDIIVDSANPEPKYDCGLDQQIYKAAGEEELLRARKQIGNIAPGQAVITEAFHLPAKKIIHTVGPWWIDGNHGEKEILEACYTNSLNLAIEENAQSIAFPLIATGIYQFPKTEAMRIAIASMRRFDSELSSSDKSLLIYLVLFDEETIAYGNDFWGSDLVYLDKEKMDKYMKPDSLPLKQIADREYDYFYSILQQADSAQSLKGFLKDSLVNQGIERILYNINPFSSNQQLSQQIEFESNINEIRKRKGRVIWHAAQAVVKDKGIPVDCDRELSNMLERIKPMTFAQKLMSLKAQAGIRDVELYSQAEVSRASFYKYQNGDDIPKKDVILRIAFILELPLQYTIELLMLAGYAINTNDKRDMALAYLLASGQYSIDDADDYLRKQGLQPLLKDD